MKKCFTCKMDQGRILSDTFLQMKQTDLHMISDMVFFKHSVKCMSVR